MSPLLAFCEKIGDKQVAFKLCNAEVELLYGSTTTMLNPYEKIGTYKKPKTSTTKAALLVASQYTQQCPSKLPVI